MLAGGEAEVGSRTAYIVDISLKIGVLGNLFGFVYNGIVRARRNIASLMKGECAEVACTKAAAVVYDGKLHLLNGRNPACGFIGGVIGAHKGQGIDLVHFLHVQREGRWVLYQKALAVCLKNGFAVHMVSLVILYFDRTGIRFFALQGILIRRTSDNRERNLCGIVCKVGNAADIANGISAMLSCLQIFGKLQNRTLAHTIHQRVGAGGG